MKCIVTGGAGFIGSNLVEALVESGNEVVVVDNYYAGNRPERRIAGATYHHIDIVDPSSSLAIFQGAETVFHLAAVPRVQYSIEQPEETLQVNVNGTARILKGAKDYGVQRVIFASSSSVYGDLEELPLHEDARTRPKSPYGLQKFFGEGLCTLWSDIYGLSTVSLRLFNVYGQRLDPSGEYALIMGRFITQKRGGLPLTVTGDGEQSRDFTHVSDVVRAFLLAATSPLVGKGEVINIGGGRDTTINHLAELFGGTKVHIPARLEPRYTRASITKARELLSWEPKVSVEDGVRELVRMYC